MGGAVDHDNYSDEYLGQILADVHSIAVVGASPRPERDSYKVMQVLIDAGYEVFPVNPHQAGNSILGRPCYASLAAIGHAVDMVDVFRAADAVPGVTREAIDSGAKVLWMQLGIRNDSAAARAEAAGLRVVMNRCPKQELAKPYWKRRTQEQ